MKIEIELSELDQIREEARVANEQLEELKAMWATVDPENEHKRICDLAFAMFTAYERRVLKELGFDHDYLSPSSTFIGLEHYLGKEPWNSPELQVTLGASITDKYRRAFLKLGIIYNP